MAFRNTHWAVATGLLTLVVYLAIYRSLLTIAAGYYLRLDNSTASLVGVLVVMVFGSTIPAAFSAAFTAMKLFPMAEEAKILRALSILLVLLALLSIIIDLPRHNDPIVVILVHIAVTFFAIFAVKSYLRPPARN